MTSRRKYPRQSPKVRLIMIYSVKKKMKKTKSRVRKLILKSQEKMRRRKTAATPWHQVRKSKRKKKMLTVKMTAKMTTKTVSQSSSLSRCKSWIVMTMIVKLVGKASLTLRVAIAKNLPTLREQDPAAMITMTRKRKVGRPRRLRRIALRKNTVYQESKS